MFVFNCCMFTFRAWALIVSKMSPPSLLMGLGGDFPPQVHGFVCLNTGPTINGHYFRRLQNL